MNDAPLGWAGRLMDWLRFSSRLVLVNLLFVIGSLAGLVVLGVFPAAVAATTVLGRLRNGSAGDSLVKDFVTAYRFQFLHANRVGSAFWIAGVVLVLDFATLLGPAGTAVPPAVHAVLLTLSTLAAIGTAAAAVTAVALCSRYRDSVAKTWRTAFMLPLVSPVMSLSLLLTLAAAAVVFSGMTVLVPLVGASVPLLISGWLVGRRLTGMEAAGPSPA
ncbi:YesL family protein [Pseudarthrobacter sp. NPDC092184]|uniref:YesL family protein n=1 Tax=unclassified Pseudarthrobacter TaxID=2647000 RepID=UPI003828A470